MASSFLLLISLNKALASDKLYNITFNNVVVTQVSPSFSSIVKFILHIGPCQNEAFKRF